MRIENSLEIEALRSKILALELRAEKAESDLIDCGCIAMGAIRPPINPENFSFTHVEWVQLLADKYINAVKILTSEVTNFRTT